MHCKMNSLALELKYSIHDKVRTVKEKIRLQDTVNPTKIFKAEQGQFFSNGSEFVLYLEIWEACSKNQSQEIEVRLQVGVIEAFSLCVLWAQGGGMGEERTPVFPCDISKSVNQQNDLLGSLFTFLVSEDPWLADIKRIYIARFYNVFKIANFI